MLQITGVSGRWLWCVPRVLGCWVSQPCTISIRGSNNGWGWGRSAAAAAPASHNMNIHIFLCIINWWPGWRWRGLYLGWGPTLASSPVHCPVWPQLPSTRWRGPGTVCSPDIILYNCNFMPHLRKQTHLEGGRGEYEDILLH